MHKRCHWDLEKSCEIAKESFKGSQFHSDIWPLGLVSTEVGAVGPVVTNPTSV